MSAYYYDLLAVELIKAATNPSIKDSQLEHLINRGLAVIDTLKDIDNDLICTEDEAVPADKHLLQE